MAKVEGRTLRMDDYEFTQFMARGVTSGQFTFGLLTGGVCFIVLSLFAWGFYLEDNGLSHLIPSRLGFFHLIPWLMLVSLLFALFFSPLGTKGAIQDTLEQIAKDNKCRDLSVWIKDARTWE